MFSMHWPSVWAAKGYSTFEFGFLQEDQAREWQEALTDSIASLKERHQVGGGGMRRAGERAQGHHQSGTRDVTGQEGVGTRGT